MYNLTVLYKRGYYFEKNHIFNTVHMFDFRVFVLYLKAGARV